MAAGDLAAALEGEEAELALVIPDDGDFDRELEGALDEGDFDKGALGADADLVIPVDGDLVGDVVEVVVFGFVGVTPTE